MAIETRRRILEVALRLFNEDGLANVGVRDIARALSMSPGNLAYHFATKDALVEALVLEYAAAQKAVVAVASGGARLRDHYRAIVAGMRNHLAYRFIFHSYSEAMRSSPEITALERDREGVRRRQFAAVMEPHLDAGSLDRRRFASRRERLRETNTIVMRGWIVSAAFSDVRRSERQAIAHYAKLAIALLEPCCTRKGRVELQRILDGEFDEPEQIG